MKLLSIIETLQVALATVASAQEQEPLASMLSPTDEALGQVVQDESTPNNYKFELFPLSGARCSTASSDEKSTWPTELLRDGGLEYIQKHKRGEVDIDAGMIEAFNPKTSPLEVFTKAFGSRCTRMENVDSFYMFHDDNIGHLGYGMDEKNKILYMCFMFGQDRNGVVGSGGECTYF